MSEDVGVIKIVSYKVTSRDEGGLEDIEVWMRCSQNGDPDQIFCGSAENTAHAFEKAFRQMLQFWDFDGVADESLFHYARLGITKPGCNGEIHQIHTAKLMAKGFDEEPDKELSSGMAQGSTRRAIVKAVSDLYGRTYGVTINVHWEGTEAGK